MQKQTKAILLGLMLAIPVFLLSVRTPPIANPQVTWMNLPAGCTVTVEGVGPSGALFGDKQGYNCFQFNDAFSPFWSTTGPVDISQSTTVSVDIGTTSSYVPPYTMGFYYKDSNGNWQIIGQSSASKNPVYFYYANPKPTFSFTFPSFSQNPSYYYCGQVKVKFVLTTLVNCNFNVLDGFTNGQTVTATSYLSFSLQNAGYILTIKSIAGATVSVLGQDYPVPQPSSRIVQSDGYVGFLIPNQGTYFISASMSGYGTNRKTITLTGSQTVDMTLTKLPTLTVQTDPVDCDVSVTSIGTINSGSSGKAVFTNVPPDIYTIYVKKDKYTSNAQTVDLTSNTDKTISIKLQLITYPVTITTNPTNYCSVTISDATKSTGTSGTAIFMMPIGTYSVTISKTDYYAQTKLIQVSDSPITLSITLSPVPIVYSLTVKTTPPNSNVKIYGIDEKISNPNGLVTFTNIPPNQYTIAISHDGYITKVDTLYINKNTTIWWTLTKMFTLKITTNPVGCQIVIPGQPMKITDAQGNVTYDLLGGTYQITALKSGYSSMTTNVSLTGDGEVSFDLQQQKTETKIQPPANQTKPPKATPGFEIPIVIFAIAMMLIIYRRKK